MINKDNEVKMLAIEKVSEGVKNIFCSRKNRAILGIIGMGINCGLLISAYIKLPEDEGEIDDEN